MHRLQLLDGIALDDHAVAVDDPDPFAGLSQLKPRSTVFHHRRASSRARLS